MMEAKIGRGEGPRHPMVIEPRRDAVMGRMPADVNVWIIQAYDVIAYSVEDETMEPGWVEFERGGLT